MADRQTQCVLHGVLAIAGRYLQNFQVLAYGNTPAVIAAKAVVSHAKMARWEQIRVILVVLKRARFAHQGIDHMTVIDGVLATAGQTRHLLNQDARVPHFNMLHVDHHVDSLADQTAGHRVRVTLDLYRTAAANLDTSLTPHMIQATRRQLSQQRLFFGKLVATSLVASLDQLAEKCFVLATVGKVTTATQQQGLIDGRFQMTVRRFHVSVLVSFAGIDRLGFHTVVRHQLAVPRAKLSVFGEIVHGRAETIRSMFAGDAAHLPKRVLDSAAESFERFGETDGHRFPIGIRQRAVVQQMIEGLAGDRHTQRIHRSEVGGR